MNICDMQNKLNEIKAELSEGLEEIHNSPLSITVPNDPFYLLKSRKLLDEILKNLDSYISKKDHRTEASNAGE